MSTANNTAAAIEYSTSFKLVITGDDNVDYTSPVTDDDGDTIPMAASYEINFTTKEAGGPAVVAIQIEEDDTNDGYESSDPTITAGDVDVDADRDIFVKFNKMIDTNAAGGAPADGSDASDDADRLTFSTNTAQSPDGNIVLEKYDFANSQWDGVDLTDTAGTQVAATLTNVDDASGEYAYVTIDANDIDPNTRYRIRVIHEISGSSTEKVEDKNDNELDEDYTFNYFVTGPGPAVEIDDPSITNTQVNLSGGYAKGSTTIVADANNGADNSWIAIEQVDGTTHLTKLNDATANTSWIFEDGTTAGVADNARITMVPTVWRYATGVEVDEHIVIAIDGNDQDTTANNKKIFIIRGCQVFDISKKMIVSVDNSKYIIYNVTINNKQICRGGIFLWEKYVRNAIMKKIFQNTTKINRERMVITFIVKSVNLSDKGKIGKITRKVWQPKEKKKENF